jgi:hypothetical protein
MRTRAGCNSAARGGYYSMARARTTPPPGPAGTSPGDLSDKERAGDRGPPDANITPGAASY